MSTKRKRGPNFTAQEINKLMELVKKHHSVVEDKRMMGPFLRQKKEAWAQICDAYNSVASSGQRTMEQLKILYENQKQYVKKNKQRFKKEHINYFNTSDDERQNEDKEQTQSENNLSLNLTNRDLKMLTLIKQRLSQFSSSDDNKEIYFEDGVSNEKIHDGDDQGQFIVPEHFLHIDTGPIDSDQSYAGSSIDDNDNKRFSDNEQKPVIKTDTMKSKTAAHYRRLYFMKKCQNAILEKKKICQEMRLRRKEHNMRHKEHQLRLRIMIHEHKTKMYSVLKD